jgi:hypothetical protein
MLAARSGELKAVEPLLKAHANVKTPPITAAAAC